MRKIKDEYFLIPFRANIISSEVIFLNQTGGIIFGNAEKCIDQITLTEYVAEYFDVVNDKEATKQISEFIKVVIDNELLQYEEDLI